MSSAIPAYQQQQQWMMGNNRCSGMGHWGVQLIDSTDWLRYAYSAPTLHQRLLQLRLLQLVAAAQHFNCSI